MKIRTWDLNAKSFHLIPILVTRPYTQLETVFVALHPASLVSWEGGHLSRQHNAAKFPEFRPPPQSTPDRQFSSTKTVRVSPCHDLRKIWLVGIIRQSYGNFSKWISDLDCPFGYKSETKFLRSKAFEILACCPEVSQKRSFSTQDF
ncbi:UNVERIFIED_CONTAM: hypothetical protein NCL1_15766 [Trichonephila clavipes]